MNVKVCPHCGGSAYLNSNYSYKVRAYFVFVKCDICGATGKTYCTPDNPMENEWNTQACMDAINAWNMRYKEGNDEHKEGNDERESKADA